LEVDVISRLVLVFLILLLLVPSLAHGDIRRFIPTIYSYEGELYADAFLLSEHRTADRAADTDKKHLFFSQRFVFTTKGWVYHPKFILFLAKIGLGLNEDSITGSSGGLKDGFTLNSLQDYEFRALILPEHPYNLELFTLRQNPYITGKFSEGIETLSYRTGAIFKYKQKPYKAALSYNISTIESLKYTTDTKALNANASYYKDWGNFSGAISHTDSDTSFAATGSTSSADRYAFGNQLRFLQNKIYLTSDLSQNNLKQEDLLRTFDNRRFSWTEDLNIELPWRFNVHLYFNYFKDDTTTHENATGFEDALWSKSYSGGISIQHKLYASLTTIYNLSYLSNSSSTGEAKGPNQSFSSTYTKNIPAGVLKTGISLSSSEIERTDSLTILNHIPPRTPIFGEFMLPQEVDVSSLDIRVRDDNTGFFYQLEPTQYDDLPPVGNSIPIRILDIPVEAKNFLDPFYEYTFQVTYSLTPEHVKLRTDTTGYFLKLHLFNYLVTPYYSHTHSEQKTLSGSLSGGPDNNTTDIAGVLFQKNPYSLEIQYQNTQSTLSPFKRYRIEAKYQKAIMLDAWLNARAYYTSVSYTHGSSQTGNSLSENSLGGEISLQKRFPKKNLTTNLGLLYSQTTGGSTSSHNYLADASLIRTMGKLEIRAGLKVGGSVIEQTGKRETLNQYYYLSLRRKLF
jgi:hypothetical protein